MMSTTTQTVKAEGNAPREIEQRQYDLAAIEREARMTEEDELCGFGLDGLDDGDNFLDDGGAR